MTLRIVLSLVRGGDEFEALGKITGHFYRRGGSRPGIADHNFIGDFTFQVAFRRPADRQVKLRRCDL